MIAQGSMGECVCVRDAVARKQVHLNTAQMFDWLRCGGHIRGQRGALHGQTGVSCPRQTFLDKLTYPDQPTDRRHTVIIMSGQNTVAAAAVAAGESE